MSLQDQIDKMRKEIRTDHYSMSIGEWISLYEKEEIDIHPEFQRFYRWSDTQKSKLIESIFLGIPIPPIFVSQQKSGVWDVIDGLQRLSTIYQFVGILRDEHKKMIPPLILEKTKYLSFLEGKKWDDSNDQKNSLSVEQRLLIKRSKIDVSIILRESDQIAKYELFQRINTGGSNLTPQEVRNCILVMTNPSLHKWLETLAADGSFRDCIALSEKNLKENYDMELALRFLVFSTIDIKQYDRVADVGEYLTEKMVEIAKDRSFDRKTAELRFKGTFEYLQEVSGQDSFRRFNRDGFKGGFLLSPYEVIAFGLGFNYPKFPIKKDALDKIKKLYVDETYKASSGSGVRANSRLPSLIPLGRKMFRA